MKHISVLGTHNQKHVILQLVVSLHLPDAFVEHLDEGGGEETLTYVCVGETLEKRRNPGPSCFF
jgi:hypothetical protein